MKRIISMMLSVMMMFSSMSIFVHAEEAADSEQTPDPETAEVQEEEPEETEEAPAEITAEEPAESEEVPEEKEELSDEEPAAEESSSVEEIVSEPEEETETIEASNDGVPVTEIKLSSTFSWLEKGKHLQLCATVMPYNAGNKNVIWSSSNESVAVVDQNGIVTAVETGTVSIYAESADGQISSECVVEITPDYGGNSARIYPAYNGRLYVRPGESAKIPVVLENYTGAETVSYELDYANYNCISLDPDGTVYANSYGDANVIAVLDNGESCYIHVYVYSDDFEEITADRSSYVLNLQTGTRYVYVRAECSDYRCNYDFNADFSFEIEDTSIVTLEDDYWGPYLVPQQVGQTRMKITAQNGVSTDWIDVTVVDSDATVRPEGNGRFYVKKGESEQIPVVIENSTDGTETVTFELEYANNDCIRLDPDGTVYADDYGNASVRAVLDNGNECSIQVCVYSDEVERIEVYPESLIINLRSGDYGRYYQVRAVYSDDKQTDENHPFRYEIEDPTIIRHEEEQYGTQFYPMKVGHTRMKISATNGVSTDWIDVTVLDGDYAESITKNQKDIYCLGFGDSATLEYELGPKGGTFADEHVTFRFGTRSEYKDTSDIIDLDPETGRVTALKNGREYVTAETVLGNRTTFNVIVQPAMTSLKFDGTKNYTFTTETRSISLRQYLQIEPSDLLYADLIFTSSDPSVLSFYSPESSSCQVLKAGKATITVTSESNPNLRTSHEFTVVNAVNPTSIKAVGQTERTFYLNHTNMGLRVEYGPSTAKTGTIWTSSNPEVASVNSSTTTAFIQCYKPGTAVITAQSQNNKNLTVKYTVNVVDTDPPAGTYQADVTLKEYEEGLSWNEYKVLAENPESVTMFVGQERVMEFNFTSSVCVPAHGFDSLFNQMTTVSSKGIYGGGTGGPDVINMGEGFLITAVKPGTETLRLGNEYTCQITVLDLTTETTDPVVTAEPDVDESLIHDLTNSEDMALSDEMAEAVLQEIDLDSIDTENVKEIYAETYLDINAIESTVDETDNSVTITLDITPKYQIITEKEDGTTETSEAMELPISGPVDMVIPLGNVFADSDIDKVYIIHRHNGKEYQYEGHLGDGVVTFTNLNGFSEFTITDKDRSVAKIGSTSYLTLQEAAEALKDNDVLTITDGVAENEILTIDKEVTFTLNKETEKNVVINAGDGYDLTVEGDVYTVKSQWIRVKSITLEGDQTVELGKNKELKYVILPIAAENKNVTWESGNEDVATVDQNGKVTPKKPGTSVITAVTEDGSYTDTCKVKVLFDDVTKPSQYYYDAVYWAVERNITQGMGPTSFNPGGFCKRYQFVLFLWRQAGCPEPELKEDPFTDVMSDPKKDVYEKAVLWAVDKEITTGTTPTTFDPYAPLTRGQVVTFLYRAAGKPEVSTTTNPFKDLDSSKYYYTPVLWAVENGITTGLNKTQFGPVNTCTRGQTVLFMYRQFKE